MNTKEERSDAMTVELNEDDSEGRDLPENGTAPRHASVDSGKKNNLELTTKSQASPDSFLLFRRDVENSIPYAGRKKRFKNGFRHFPHELLSLLLPRFPAR